MLLYLFGQEYNNNNKKIRKIAIEDEMACTHNGENNEIKFDVCVQHRFRTMHRKWSAHSAKVSERKRKIWSTWIGIHDVWDLLCIWHVFFSRLLLFHSVFIQSSLLYSLHAVRRRATTRFCTILIRWLVWYTLKLRPNHFVGLFWKRPACSMK